MDAVSALQTESHNKVGEAEFSTIFPLSPSFFVRNPGTRTRRTRVLEVRIIGSIDSQTQVNRPERS